MRDLGTGLPLTIARFCAETGRARASVAAATADRRKCFMRRSLQDQGEGQKVSIASACRPPAVKSRSASYTSRCCANLARPANFGEAIRTRKWVPKPVPSAPAWPACCQLSSSTSSRVGARDSSSRARSASAVMPVAMSIGLDVAAQVERLREDEQHHEADAAECLEVHPRGFREVEGHPQIERTHGGEERGPGPPEV